MLAPTGLPCPVCGTPAGSPATAPCPTCGLPAVGQAALVVARIGATLAELARDRDALLATLRTHAAPKPAPAPAAAPQWAAPPGAHPPVPAAPGGEPPRGLSPQQVLLGLGALLLVAGAVAFVALAWTRLGLAFQATVMLAVTTAAAALSAWAARRRLRATEETLAAAAAALLLVDLGAGYAKGLAGVDEIPLRLWSAIVCATVVAAGLGLGRLSRTTVTWPLAALLAAQPIAFLLLPPGQLAGPAAVGVAFLLAGGNLLAGGQVLAGGQPRAHWRLRRSLAPVARVLAALAAATGAIGAPAVAAGDDPLRSWLAAGAVAAAGVAAGCWAMAARLRWLGVVAVALLVVAAWSALIAGRVTTPEAYTLPAAAALLVIALPALRAGRPSWGGEAAAVALGLIPSALLAVGSPTAVRLVLVVAAATAVTVAAVVTHRQAPFVLGAASLVVVVIGRLAPYAPLLPRWVTLSVAGLLLLAVGATYERRRQQAREAVAWVAQMR